MNIQLLILFLSGIGLGLAYICEKKLSFEKYHPATFVVLISGVSSVVSLPLLVYKFQVPTNIYTWLIVLLSVAVYAIGMISSFKAYKLLDASEVGLINRLNILFTALVGSIIFSETISGNSIIGLLLVLSGCIVVLFDGNKIKINKGIIYALIMAIGYGLAAIFDKYILNYFSPFTYIAVNSFMVTMFALTFGQARYEAVQLMKSRPGLIILAGILSAGSWIGFLYTLQSGSISRVFPIYDSLALVCTVGVGILFLGEKEKVIQKLIGTTLVVVGIFLLG